MDFLTPERITTLLGFLGILVLAWLAVHLRNGGKLTDLPKRAVIGSALEVSSVKSLGDGTRAIILNAAGTDVLVITHRKTGAQVIALNKPETGGADT